MKKREYFSFIKRVLLALFVLPLGLFSLSCNQDPIFFNISVEPEPRTPKIEGSPQNMVVTTDGIYVWRHGYRGIWFFNAGIGRWENFPRPGGIIGGLAAVETGDTTQLYAVVQDAIPPTQTEIWRFYDGTWGEARAYPAPNSSSPFLIGSIYSAGDQLFARAQRRSNLEAHDILHIVTDNTNGAVTSVTSIKPGNDTISLRGAVRRREGNIYLATANAGIFRFENNPLTSPPTVTQTVTPAELDFVVNGMIETGEDIVVAGNTHDRGRTFVLAGSDREDQSGELPRWHFFTGGMGVWKQFNSDSRSWEPALLLLGIWTLERRLNNGYREIDLNPDGSVPSLAFSTPGIPAGTTEGRVSSVQSRPRYNASIGTRAVQFIQQVPPEMLRGDPAVPSDGWQPPIFASTARDGLWVYNPANDEWNSEDNTRVWRRPMPPQP